MCARANANTFVLSICLLMCTHLLLSSSSSLFKFFKLCVTLCVAWSSFLMHLICTNEISFAVICTHLKRMKLKWKKATAAASASGRFLFEFRLEKHTQHAYACPVPFEQIQWLMRMLVYSMCLSFARIIVHSLSPFLHHVNDDDDGATMMMTILLQLLLLLLLNMRHWPAVIITKQT